VNNASLPASFIDPSCERELLATCIANPTLAPLAAEKVNAEDFGVALLGKVFRAMGQVLADGKTLDEFAIENKLNGDSEYESAGGLKFLIEISSCAVPTSRPSAIDGLAEAVKTNALRRRFRQTVNGAQERSEDPRQTVGELITDLRESVTRLEDESEISQRGMIHVAEVTRELAPILTRLSDRPGDMLGFSTGYRSLNRASSGLQPSSFTVLAARPSMGKTALALNIAENVARMGNPVAVFSLETPRDMLQLRLVCRHGRIDLSSLTSGQATDEAWKRLAPAIAEVSQLPIYVDDRPRPRGTDLRWRIRAAARRFGVKLVIVDYLQLATGKGDTRNDEVAGVSGELQAAARELGKITGGALMVLSQLNRLADGERPRLSHLRDSGAIEQDADAVWFLCEPKGTRPGQFEPSTKELDIAKSRNGPTGTVRFNYIGQCMAFEELE
jgi:replicative DNA helicase